MPRFQKELTMILLIVTAIALCGLFAMHSPNSQLINRGGVNLSISTQVKGLLALIIILHHVSFHFKEHFIIGQFGCWGTAVVSIFFFFSGYGLIKSRMRKGEKYIDDFLSKRLGKLLPAFLLATGIFMAIELIGDKSITWFADRFISGFPPLPTSWFIYTIIFFYLAFYASCRSMRSILYLNIAMFGFSVIYSVVVLFVFHWGGWWVNAILALNLGVFTASYEKQILGYMSVRKYLPLATAIVLTAISAFAIFKHLTPVYNLTLCALLWMALVTTPEFNSRVLSFLGRTSYEIYLVQGAVIALLSRKDILSSAGPYGAVAITCIVSIIAAVCLKFIADRSYRICQ